MIPTTFALFERVEIGSVTPIGAIPGQLGKIAVLLQIRQCTLDGAAGEVHISRNRLDPRAGACRRKCCQRSSLIHLLPGKIVRGALVRHAVIVDVLRYHYLLHRRVVELSLTLN